MIENPLEYWTQDELIAEVLRLTTICDASAGSASRETPTTEDSPRTYDKVKMIASLRVEVNELKAELEAQYGIIDLLLEEIKSYEQEGND